MVLPVNSSYSVSAPQVMKGIADFTTQPVVFMAVNNLAMAASLVTPAIVSTSLLILSDAAREVNDVLKGPRAFSDSKKLLEKYESLQDNEKIKYFFGFGYSALTTFRLLAKISVVILGKVAFKNICLIRQAFEAVASSADIGISSQKTNRPIATLEIVRGSAKVIQSTLVALAILNVISLSTLLILPTTTAITVATIGLSILNAKVEEAGSLHQKKGKV